LASDLVPSLGYYTHTKLSLIEGMIMDKFSPEEEEEEEGGGANFVGLQSLLD